MTLQSERTRGVQPERPQQPNSIENPTGHSGACADTAFGCLPKRDMGPLEVSTWKMRETGMPGWESPLDLCASTNISESGFYSFKNQDYLQFHFGLWRPSLPTMLTKKGILSGRLQKIYEKGL